MENGVANQNTELQVFNNSLTIFKDGGAILTANQDRVNKALAAGRQLLEQIKSKGMSPEMDVALNTYLVKLKKTYENMNESRKPITQIMDEVKKIFTALEAPIDPKSKDNIYSEIVSHRNAWARQLEQEQKQREEEARIKLAKENERIDIVSRIEGGLGSSFNDILFKEKSKVSALFQQLTLANFNEISEALTKYSWLFSKATMQSYRLIQVFRYHDSAAVLVLTEETLTRLYTRMFDKFNSEMETCKHGFVDQLQSRREELENIAKAEAERIRLEELSAKTKNEAEKERLRLQAVAQEEENKRLKAIAEEREKEEELKRQKDLEEANRISLQDADSNKMIAETEATIVTEASIVSDAPAPETRKEWKITVLHQLGYMEIFKFWFESEGKSLTMDELDKKSLGQMKSFAEKKMNKEGVQIEGKYMKYEEVIKTVVRKTKES